MSKKEPPAMDRQVQTSTSVWPEHQSDSIPYEMMIRLPFRFYSLNH